MEAEIRGKPIPDWLSVDPQAMTGRVLTAPTRDLVGSRVDDRLIIEYYSR